MSILFSTATLMADHSIIADRYGKRIQLDGFLMEWNSKTANVWKDDGQTWYIDAINTAEGLSGYIRSDSAVRCSSWTFSFNQPSNVKTIRFNYPVNGDSLYKDDRRLYDSLGIITLEWLISWDRISFDSAAGTYSLFLTASSTCGDSLPLLKISGSRYKSKNVSFASLIFRAVLIILLVTFYLLLNQKIRSRKQT